MPAPTRPGPAATAGRPNKRMQLTKLRAAPVLQAEVPPCAPAGQTNGGTASQLIRGVRRTVQSSAKANVRLVIPSSSATVCDGRSA
jgi:hypothetical protein